jgi:hypothetical protein
LDEPVPKEVIIDTRQGGPGIRRPEPGVVLVKMLFNFHGVTIIMLHFNCLQSVINGEREMDLGSILGSNIFKRKQLRKVVEVIQRFHPQAFYSVEDVRHVSKGVFAAKEPA